MEKLQTTLREVGELEELRTFEADLARDHENCAVAMTAHSTNYRTDECVTLGLARIAWIDLQR